MFSTSWYPEVTSPAIVWVVRASAMRIRESREMDSRRFSEGTRKGINTSWMASAAMQITTAATSGYTLSLTVTFVDVMRIVAARRSSNFRIIITFSHAMFTWPRREGWGGERDEERRGTSTEQVSLADY